MATGIGSTSAETPAGSVTPDTSPTKIATTDPISGTQYYLGDVFTYIIGPVDLWLGLQAIIMNILVISFYHKQYTKIVPFMYLLIAVCDLFTGITAILNALFFFLIQSETEYALRLIQPSYAISSITFKVSVFLNLMIAVIRTINIYKPFYHTNLVLVGNTILFYTAGWIAFVIWQLVDSNPKIDKTLTTFFYRPGNYHALYRDDTDKPEQFRNISLFLGIPFVLPSVLAVLCMGAQIKAILKQHPEKMSNTSKSRKITITILMLTALFFVCNTVYLGYAIYEFTTTRAAVSHSDRLSYARRAYMMSYLTGVAAPFINAAFNPVILIVRGEALISYIKRNIKRLSTSTQILHVRSTKSLNNTEIEIKALSEN